jgi:hypothetical protein
MVWFPFTSWQKWDCNQIAVLLFKSDFQLHNSGSMFPTRLPKMCQPTHAKFLTHALNREIVLTSAMKILHIFAMCFSVTHHLLQEEMLS